MLTCRSINFIGVKTKTKWPSHPLRAGAITYDSADTIDKHNIVWEIDIYTNI